MKKLLIIILIAPLFVFSQKQEKCGNKHIFNNNPQFKQAVNKTLNNIHNTTKTKKQSDSILRIPVVVHVVYENTTENISDNIILSQINALNRDFRRQNADTTNTRVEFDTIAADTKIEFFLATIDPFGQPTTGITRTPTTETSFIDLTFNLDKVKSALTGGKDAWPVEDYLNIWVCDLSISLFGTSAPFVLGFAYPPAGISNWPPGSTPTNPMFDGVVVHYEVFGENNPLSTLNFGGTTIYADKGRVCVHEVGHYLGLRHIWGDGDCTQDDGIIDTPKSDSQADFQCDFTKNTCIDSPYNFPDMIENYMDYSEEECQNMFTKGQKDIMRTTLETVRLPLVLLNTNTNNLEENTNNIKIFPNPTTRFINIESNQKIEKIEIYTTKGKRVFEQKNNSQKTTIDFNQKEKGLYFLKITNKNQTKTFKQIIN